MVELSKENLVCLYPYSLEAEGVLRSYNQFSNSSLVELGKAKTAVFATTEDVVSEETLNIAHSFNGQAYLLLKKATSSMLIPIRSHALEKSLDNSV
jgi:hypothetical protein